jgi:RND family efflux transporter MFP subunit
MGKSILMLAVILCGCSRTPSPATAAAASEAPAVAAARAEIKDLSRDVVLTAEFIPFEEVDVMAKVSGYVKNIAVDVGDHVLQGQTLATLEIPEMQDDRARAQATIDQAQADVNTINDDIRRAESAHEMAHLSSERLAGVIKERPGLVAQQEIDDARSRDLIAEAQVAAEKSRLIASQQKVSVTQAELARVKTMLAYAEVTAPFAGVVTKRYADTGSMIQAGTASQTQAMPLVRLSRNSLLRLILPVPESIVSLVHVGQQLTVRVPTLNQTFTGKVARFSDRVQTSTRTMDTEIDVPNPTFKLVPGMYAEATVATATRNHALTIPIAAVDLAGGNETAGKVMTVNGEGIIEPHDVRLGLQSEDRFEILSGIEEGAVVITANRGNLRPGQQVRPRVAN